MNNKNYLIYFLALLLSCNTNQDLNPAISLIGEWEDAYGADVKIVFTESGEYFRFFEGATSKNVILEKDDTGMFVEHDYGPFHYKIDAIHGDSISCRIVGSKNGKLYARRIFIPKEGRLIEMSYKTLPGIENHIDEVSYYKKVGSPDVEATKEIVEKIILPQGHLGSIYIAYDQEEGLPVELDEWGNRILEIPKSGLLKTSMTEDPEILATDRFEFYERDSISGQLSRLREYQHGEFRSTAYRLKDKNKSVTLKYDSDSTALFVWGFNQSGRKRTINKVFGEVIEGNVLSLEVDTVKSRLRLERYGAVVKD